MNTEHPLDGSARRARDSQNVLDQLYHDIRAAMSDVIGGLRLVELDRLDPQSLTQVERVRVAADTLAGLMDSVLLAASGQKPASPETSNLALRDWIDALTRRWSGRAVEQGGALKVHASGHLPERLRVAALVLDRLVGNLVVNAMTHAPGCDVAVDIRPDAAGGLRIDVVDTGPGFPAEMLAAIGTGQPTRSAGQFGGSGMGLDIVRALAAEIGAGLRFDNTTPEGGGAVSLHLPEALLDWTGSVRRGLPPPDLSGLDILVAEDNVTNQLILKQMLEDLGARTRITSDGEAALAALAAHPFDLALIDIEMPKLNGLEVMKRTRAMPGAMAQMPMVAITAYVLRDNREAIYAAGADGIIGKPIASDEELGRSLMRYVGRPTGQPEPEDIAASGRGSEKLDQQMDHARMERLLEAAGPDGRAELLDRLVEDLRSVKAALSDAVALHDIGEIRAQTHILIAISGAVGADRLCQLSEVLNIAAKRKRVGQLALLHDEVHCDLGDLIALVAEMGAGRSCT